MNTHYSVYVELDRIATRHDIEQLLVALPTEWHPAVGTSPAGRLDVQLTLLSENAQSAAFSTGAIAQAAGAAVVRLEVQTESEFNAREGFADTRELVSVSEAADIYGVSRQRVQQMIDEGKLPTATKVGSATVISRADVLAKIHRAGFRVNPGSDIVSGPVPIVDGNFPAEITEPISDNGVLSGTWVRSLSVDLRSGTVFYSRRAGS